jgi:antitoxin (DNA-binding transcriptional repressor) of toxin-antitoxin stability system
MPIIGVRQLCRDSRKVFADLAKTGEPVIIARHNKPIAALVRVDESQMTDLVLSAAPEFLESVREADEDLAAGRAEPLGAVLADLADEDPDGDAMLGELAGATVGAGPYGDLIGQVSRDIVESAPIELGSEDALGLRELNEEILRTAFTAELRGAFASALHRVRALNMNALSASDADVTVGQYRVLLEGASVLERLSSGRPTAAGLLDSGSAIESMAAFPAGAAVGGQTKRHSASAARGRRPAKTAKPAKR